MTSRNGRTSSASTTVEAQVIDADGSPRLPPVVPETSDQAWKDVFAELLGKLSMLGENRLADPRLVEIAERLLECEKRKVQLLEKQIAADERLATSNEALAAGIQEALPAIKRIAK